MFLGLGLMLSSFSVRYTPNVADPSIMFNHVKGNVYLSSMNSAQKTIINQCRTHGDTLFIVDYKRCVFCTEKNLVLITAFTKFVKCAGRVYKVEKANEGFSIAEVSK